VTKSLREARNHYIGSIIDTAFQVNDTKPFWRFIKSQRNDCPGIAALKSGDHLVADASSKAEILNHEFKSVFSKEDTTTVPTLRGPRFPSISKITINSYGVGKLLSNLGANKASGPDNILCRMLKELADEISPVLTDIFQLSITTGTLPADWKRARVTPVFNRGDRHLAENYRPISVTCVCCKILEHIICRPHRLSPRCQ